MIQREMMEIPQLETKEQLNGIAESLIAITTPAI
jgi:hypothetical protein